MVIKNVELNENSLTRVKKAIYGDPTGKIQSFAIISADNHQAKKMPSRENKKWRERMKGIFGKELKDVKDNEWLDSVDKALRDSHYQYIQATGQYGSAERSFIIVNIPLSSAKEISDLFKQESFIWGKYNEKNGKVDVYFYRTETYSGSESYTEFDKATGIDLKSKDFDNFTQRNGFKFSFHFPTFEELIPCNNPKAFEESMEEDRSAKSKLLCRAIAYGGQNSNKQDLSESSESFSIKKALEQLKNIWD